MEKISENAMAMDSNSSQIIDFVPIVRSGEWSDIGSRKNMEDTHVCIADLAKKFGHHSLDREVVSFYGVSNSQLIVALCSVVYSCLVFVLCACYDRS